MSEIDKLVNRAYPDELRRVTPIAVDEGAVLAQTLEKLGLAGAKRPSRRRRRPERYAGRHEARREARLVEVPVEPPRRRWIGWAGWAAAACIAVACAVNFGPALLEHVLVYPTGARTAGDYAGPQEGGGEAGGVELQKAAEQPPRLSSYAGESLAAGMDQAKAAVLRMDPSIHLLRLSRLDEKDQFTLVLYFPETPQAQIAQCEIGIGGPDLEVVKINQNIQDNFAYLTYQLNSHNCGGTGLDQVELYIYNNAAVDFGMVDDVAFQLFLGKKTSSASVRLDYDAGSGSDASPSPDYEGGELHENGAATGAGGTDSG